MRFHRHANNSRQPSRGRSNNTKDLKVSWYCRGARRRLFWNRWSVCNAAAFPAPVRNISTSPTRSVARRDWRYTVVRKTEDEDRSEGVRAGPKCSSLDPASYIPGIWACKFQSCIVRLRHSVPQFPILHFTSPTFVPTNSNPVFSGRDINLVPHCQRTCLPSSQYFNSDYSTPDDRAPRWVRNTEITL